MEKIIEIASNVSTPIALSGLIAAFLFFIFRKILGMNIFSKISQNNSFKILQLIINKIFIVSIVAMILGFFGYILPFLLAINSVQDTASIKRDNQLLVKYGRFEPMPTFFTPEQKGFKSDFYETAFLYITLQNIDNEPIILTSMDASEIKGKKILSEVYSTAGFGKEIGKNKPIIIKPGEEVEVKYSTGFKFHGLATLLDIESLKNESYYSEERFKLSNRVALIDELNNNLASILGSESAVEIKLYTKKKELLIKHVFEIANGKTLFNVTGGLHHDAFLGELIHLAKSSIKQTSLNKKMLVPR